MWHLYEKSINCLVAGVSLIAMTTLFPSQAHAFKISPDGFSPQEINQKHHRWIDRIASPVHENMAFRSYICAGFDPISSNKCDFSIDPPSGYIIEDPLHLVYGVRWNDDPNNFFASGNPLEWAFWMTNAELLSKVENVGKLYRLEHRSHFGDLQILHGMSTKGVSPTITHDAVMEWVHFSYDVAAGFIPLESKLGQLHNYKFSGYFRGTKKEYWTVRRLYSNVEDDKGGVLPSLTDENIKLMALGAILHTIQDSYSNSHVERENSQTIQPSHGSIVAFLDYSSQKSSCHGPADIEPEWLFDKVIVSGPILQGAKVVQHAKRKDDWASFHQQLDDAVFKVSTKARSADGGAFSSCSEI